MSFFTCITCRVAFADAELQRLHYKTDWHRYNLKRKVAEMPPVTAENYQQRVLAQKAQLADEDKTTSIPCEACSKYFNTQNAYENHIKSKKHKELETKVKTKTAKDVDYMNKKNATTSTEAICDGPSEAHREQKAAAENVEMDADEDSNSDAGSWDEDAIGIEQCLFCSDICTDLEENVSHMTTKHSFFIPDLEFITDLEGLITYLGEKIGIGHFCLWCNEKGKAFHSTQAVQKHMLDKGHCKLLHEGDVIYEYADYYDYRSSYPDDNAEKDAEMEVDAEDIISDGYELVLPSGATIGHRSLARYYKQSFPPERRNRKSILSKVLSQYKALGWTGATGGNVQLRAKDLGFMQRMKFKHHLQTGIKANKLQHHFRYQNPL